MSPSVPASAARTDCRNPRPLLLLLPLLPHALMPLLLQLLLPHSGMRGGSAGNLRGSQHMQESHVSTSCICSDRCWCLSFDQVKAPHAAEMYAVLCMN